MKKQLAFIGDVHGKVDQYSVLMNKFRQMDIPSIQLGDFGFTGAHIWAELNLSSGEKILFGNHDDYKKIDAHYSLGHYGYIEEYDLFYVRGAYSIDKGNRHAYIDWYPEEELNYSQMNDAFNLYMEKKPKHLISHDCSETVRKKMFGYGEKTATSDFLEAMIGAHAPQLHVFGHHHTNKLVIVENTTYICVGELESLILTL